MNNLNKLLPLLFLLSLAACEEDITVTPDVYGTLVGTVVDDGTGKPIAGATLTTSPTTTALSSDAAGKFDFGQLVTGTYALRVEKSGYTQKLLSVVVKENEETAAAARLSRDTLNNHLPTAPFNLLPANIAVNQAITLIFKWRQSSDLDVGETIRYSVFLYKTGSPTDTIAVKISDTTATASNLKYSTEYRWQVAAYDDANTPVFSQLWKFTTTAAPDNRILFCRKSDGKFDIWNTNPTGSSQLQITSDGANNWRPRWRPDRKRIAFLSDQNIDAQLFTMKPDGSDIQQVTKIPVAGATTLDLDFCWKPDGSALLYMNNSRLYRINQDGTGLAVFADAPAGYTFAEVDWNGHLNIVSARVVGLFPYDSRIIQYSDAGVLQSVLVPDSPGSLGGGQFFIDGTRIVYEMDDLGLNAADGRQLDARIKVKNLTTGTVSDFSANKISGTNDLDPRWSPDGSKVIFVNTNNDGISPRSLWWSDGTQFSSGRAKILDNAEMPDWR